MWTGSHRPGDFQLLNLDSDNLININKNSTLHRRTRDNRADRQGGVSHYVTLAPITTLVFLKYATENAL